MATGQTAITQVIAQAVVEAMKAAVQAMAMVVSEGSITQYCGLLV